MAQATSPPASSSSCIEDAPTPSTASFNPGSFSNQHRSSLLSSLLLLSLSTPQPSEFIVAIDTPRCFNFCRLYQFFVAAGARTSLLDLDPKPSFYLIQPTPQTITPYELDESESTHIQHHSTVLRSLSFTHSVTCGRNPSLVCLYALLRLTPFTITAETEDNGPATWRKVQLWTHYWRSIRVGDNLNFNCKSCNSAVCTSPIVTDWRTARMADSIRRVHHFGYPVRVS